MIKQLFKDSALYTISSLLSKGIGFLLLPVYVNYLSKEEYGNFDYLMASVAILSVIVSLEIGQSIIRFVSEFQGSLEKQKTYVSSGIVFTFFSYLLLIIGAIIFQDGLASLVFEDDEKSPLIIATAAVASSNALVYLATLILRAQLNARLSALVSLLSAILIAIFTVLAFEMFDFGLLGALYAQFIAGLIVIFLVYVKLKKVWFLSIEMAVLYEMLCFSVPLVFSSVGVVLLLYADRILIKSLLGFEMLAVYAVAAKFASIASLLIVGVQSAITPLIYSKLSDPKIPGLLKRVFLGYVFVSLSFVVAGYFLFEPLIASFIGAEYVFSSFLAVILCAAALVHGAYVFFPGLSIVKKTKALAIINVLTAAVNILLNWVFISLWGLVGAAYATLVSSMIFFGLNFWLSEKVYPVILD